MSGCSSQRNDNTMINIAVMGYGTVGSGVVEMFYKNRESIHRKVGKAMDIKYILDLRDFPGSPYQEKLIKDFQIIADDPDVEIVVEVMGGLEPAFTFTKTCLSRGKSVVTSNKELVAARGAELLKIAKENGVSFFFEASVGGGIPIIRPLTSCLAQDEIDEIAGILNGTTNFILTKMIREQTSFADALALAQKLGYAERNPSADVDGHDACRKICILASLCFGKHIYPEFVHTEGIRSVTLEDVAYAEDWGGVIKLIGRAKRVPGNSDKIYAMVSPALISKECQLASVDDVFNGILVRAEATGDLVFYGRGAGKLPTASAVIADVVNAAKPTDSKTLLWQDDGKNHVLDSQQDVVGMYLRLTGTSDDLQKAQNLFGEIRVLHREGQPQDEIAFVTPAMAEGTLQQKILQLTDERCKLRSAIRVLAY